MAGFEYILSCSLSVSTVEEPDTCASTTSSVLSREFQRRALPLVGGAPCAGNQGYCDKFHMCRLLDADGPIARLKNSILHLDEFEDIGEWMKVKVQQIVFYWFKIRFGSLLRVDSRLKSRRQDFTLCMKNS